MELGIALFIGFWFVLTGVITTIAIFKDYKNK